MDFTRAHFTKSLGAGGARYRDAILTQRTPNSDWRGG